MSVLPDHEIQWSCSGDRFPALIDPFNAEQLQPASYDVLLGNTILVPTEHDGTVIVNNPMASLERRTIDLAKPIPPTLYSEIDINQGSGYILFPGQFILGVTRERVQIPPSMVGRIEGKSSIGRLGLTAHITAGYLDPGFRGRITLEIVNLFARPIRLWPEIRIAQIGFEWMSSACDRPYGSQGLGSHYQDDDDVQGSRYGE